jgi:hypothetical protein
MINHVFEEKYARHVLGVSGSYMVQLSEEDYNHDIIRQIHADLTDSSRKDRFQQKRQ